MAIQTLGFWSILPVSCCRDISLGWGNQCKFLQICKSCNFCCWDICISWGEFWRTPTNANSCLPCTGLTSRGTACLFCPRLGSEFLLLTIVRLKRERSRLDLKLPPIYFLPVKCEAFEVWWFLRFETFSVIVLIGVDLMFPAVLNMGIAIQRLQR